VRHVDHQAHPVHLLDDLPAHAGDARVLRLVATGGEQALVVVAELHEAGAEVVQDLDQADVVLDGRAVLEAEDDARLALGVGAAHVIAGPDRHEPVGVELEAAVPGGDVGDGLAQVLPIADGDVHAGDAAHLLEDPGRPVAVLKPVDHQGPVGAHGVPAAM
jgi:hypothetical protein